MFECVRCKRTYRRRHVYEGHIASCNEERNMGDTIQRAMAIAHDAVYKENTVKTYGRFDVNPKLVKVCFNSDTDSRTVSVGWVKHQSGEKRPGRTVYRSLRTRLRSGSI